MHTPLEWIAAVSIGLGLAAATGFRVFLPLLMAGVASRIGALPLADGFGWLSSTEALVALTAASFFETTAYYIPGVDHLLDVLAGPAAFVAGIVASASVMTDFPPAVMWPVAIIGGGGLAATTKVTSALVRAKTGIATLGLGNPIVSTVETGGAILIAALAILIPIVCLAMVLVLLVWMLRRRRRTTAALP